MDDEELLTLLHQAASAVHGALEGLDDWGPTERPTQYRSDVVADAAALDVLVPAGLAVLSEESGIHHPERAVMVALDPVDGSTNASRGLPWYATSLCALDADGPRAAVVVNQATGTRFEAVRGAGARCDGRPIRPSRCTDLGDAMVGLAGHCPRRLGWRQYRALGAAALDLCAVAAGSLDAYIDCGGDQHAPWDYLSALLVCREAGAVVADAAGRDLVVRGHEDRRTPLAAATPALLDQVLEARASLSGDVERRPAHSAP